MYSSDIDLHLQSGAPSHFVKLLWLVGQNRSTGAMVLHGFSDDEDRTILIDGQLRSYTGGALLSTGNPIYRRGMDVDYLDVELAFHHPAVQQAIYVDVVTGGLAELHIAVLRADDMTLVDTWRAWKGDFPEVQDEDAQSGITTLKIPNTNRIMSVPSSRKISNASLQRRAPTDDFRKFAKETQSISQKAEAAWKA